MNEKQRTAIERLTERGLAVAQMRPEFDTWQRWVVISPNGKEETYGDWGLLTLAGYRSSDSNDD